MVCLGISCAEKNGCLWKIHIANRNRLQETDRKSWIRNTITNISDILDQLGKCKYFTTMDLVTGFCQIEMDSKDIPKRGFTMENGHYEFVLTPFELKNAPSTFQRVVDNIVMRTQNRKRLTEDKPTQMWIRSKGSSIFITYHHF